MAWGKTKAQQELEDKMMARLIKRGLAKNNNPKEELSRNCRRYLELKEHIDKLTAEYDALNSYIKSKVEQRGETILVPDLKDDTISYTVVIKNSTQNRLDSTKARAFLTEEQIAECTNTIDIESLSIKEVAKVAA